MTGTEAIGSGRKPGIGSPQSPQRSVTFIKGDNMRMRRPLFSGLVLCALASGAGNLLKAQEEPQFSPDLEQLRETVADRLSAMAEKLGLTDDQKTKIREAHTGFAEKYQSLRESAVIFIRKSSRHWAMY